MRKGETCSWAEVSLDRVSHMNPHTGPEELYAIRSVLGHLVRGLDRADGLWGANACANAYTDRNSSLSARKPNSYNGKETKESSLQVCKFAYHRRKFLKTNQCAGVQQYRSLRHPSSALVCAPVYHCHPTRKLLRSTTSVPRAARRGPSATQQAFAVWRAGHAWSRRMTALLFKW